MDSLTIHHTPGGLLVEADEISALISEKDFPLLRRGQPVPLRDEKTRVSIGRGNHALTRLGNVIIYLGPVEFVIPRQLWNAVKSSDRRVILTPS